MIEFPEGMEPETDVTPARWVQTALKDRPAGGVHVRHHVPPIFEAYARILHHPQRPPEGAPTGTWRERAAELGVELHGGSSWRALERDDDPWRLDPGSLSEAEVKALVRTIGAHVPDDSAWFAVSTGVLPPHRGVLLRARRMGPLTEWWARREGRARSRREERALRRLPTFALHEGDQDDYVLTGGRLGDALHLFRSLHFQSPHLWWADDHGWFVRTGNDSITSYVGGPHGLIGAVVADEAIEAFEVGADDPMVD